MSDPADKLLCQVRDAQDQQAYVELFRTLGPRVKSFLMRGGADSPEAEELTQEVFLRVWRRARSFDENRGTASSWIFTIARNARIDRQRKQKLPRWDYEDPVLVSAEPDPHQQAEAGQSAEQVRQAMAELPDAQKSVVQAAYFEHRSLSEIAASESVPLGTVKSRMRLAMKRLRQSLQPGEERT